MKNRTSLVRLVILLGAVTLCTTVLAFYFSRKAAWEALRVKWCLERANSYTRTLYEVACERFAAHQRNHQTWIFSTHDSTVNPALQKFTDGQFVLVSLPADKHQKLGFELYVTHYNGWVVRQADLLALEGDYDKALLIYRLVERFDRGGFMTEEVQQRIAILEELKAGRSVERNKRALSELSINYVHSVFEQVEASPAATVTNLFDLPVVR